MESNELPLEQWLLNAIDATKSMEALWCLTDAIKADKDTEADYLSPNVLAALRDAVAAARQRLASAEHTESIANLPRDENGTRGVVTKPATPEGNEDASFKP